MSKKVTQKRVRVLYQNLGGIWYAFADVGNDNIYFGQVPVMAAAPKGKGKKAKSSGQTKKSGQRTSTTTSRRKPETSAT